MEIKGLMTLKPTVVDPSLPIPEAMKRIKDGGLHRPRVSVPVWAAIGAIEALAAPLWRRRLPGRRGRIGRGA